MKTLIILFFALSAPFGFAKKDSQKKGREVMEEADKRDEGFKDSIADGQMILKNKQGETSNREMTVKSFEADEGDKTLVLFHKPKDVKGTALLTHPYKSKSNEQWLYLPSMKRVKRISSANQTGPFVGSEFSYEDMASHVLDKFKYNWLKDEPCGSLTCSVVEQFPTDKDSGYSKRVVWIDKEHYRIQKAEMYDRKKALLKKLVATKYKQYKNKYWRAHEVEMKNVQTGKSTTLSWGSYKFGTGLTESDFQKSALNRLN